MCGCVREYRSPVLEKDSTRRVADPIGHGSRSTRTARAQALPNSGARIANCRPGAAAKTRPALSNGPTRETATPGGVYDGRPQCLVRCNSGGTRRERDPSFARSRSIRTRALIESRMTDIEVQFEIASCDGIERRETAETRSNRHPTLLIERIVTPLGQRVKETQRGAAQCQTSVIPI